tara:strand:+ start:147 stop:335 length:189 start_codon:yes stop_codon:yes gene_type:complete
MPSPAEIQEALPLLAQLLFYAVIGALLVGSFFAIIRFMFVNAIWIILIIAVIFGYNYYGSMF